MNYFLTEEQEMLRDLCAQIAREKMLPLREELDESGEFPWEVVKVMAASDVYGVYIPEEYGGFGGGVMEMCIASEEFSKVCGGIALAFAASALGAYPILLFGSDEQKKKYLTRSPRARSSRRSPSPRPTPEATRAPSRPRAVLDGDEYVLNGTKQWITGGGEAEIYSVIARTSKGTGIRGISAFIVEKDTPGFTFGKKENKMGIRASATQGTHLPGLPGPQGEPHRARGHGLHRGHAHVRQLAARAWRRRPSASRRAPSRRPSSTPGIASSSGSRSRRSRASSSCSPTWPRRSRPPGPSSTRRRGWSTRATRTSAKISAMAKLFASDVAMKVTTDAVQILGGYGYMKEYPVEKMMRDAKITQIYEGTNQIQRAVIASQIIKESAALEKRGGWR